MGALTELQKKGADVVVVGLDSEPFEEVEAVVKHVRDNDLSGTYAVATQEMMNAMVDQFGADIITPPTSPVVLLSADQSEARLLPRGFKDLASLESELAKGP